MLNIPGIAENILNTARKHGCAAQVTVVQTDSKDINVREGNIEQLLTSIAVSTGLRLFKGKRSAIVSFSGDNFDNIEARLQTAFDAVDYLGEDDAVRLLKPAEFGEGVMPLNLDDDTFDALDTGKIAESLIEMEKAGLAVSDKITPAENAEFSASRSRVHVFTTEGLNKSFSKSYYSYYYSAVAQENGLKEVDYWYKCHRHVKEISDPALIKGIARIAAERALRRLGGKKISSGERPVVFTPRTAASLMDLMGDALDGEYILKRSSFLVGKLGQKLFPDHVEIVDDPLKEGFVGSYPFDGEGMNGIRKMVVEKGKIATFLHNSYSAIKLGMPLTGNASRSVSRAPGVTCGNFYLQPGQGTLDDLVTEMKDGLVVDTLFTSGMNDVTGDFSFGCSGFLVEGGKITMPIKEFTIAGNLQDLFKNIIAVADDNEYKRSISSPSILVSKLAVAGI